MSTDSYTLLNTRHQSDASCNGAINHYNIAAAQASETQSRSSLLTTIKAKKKTVGLVAALLVAAIVVVALTVALISGKSDSSSGTVPGVPTDPTNNGGDFKDMAPAPSSSSTGATVANATCVQLPAETEGPYWVDEKLNRSDLTTDVKGMPLALELQVYNTTFTNKCVPIVGAWVDIWEADGDGRYSDIQSEGTKGQQFLRGYQVTDANGVVNFLTIWPGWYRGRTVHIHVRVRVIGADGKTIIYNSTTQLFMDDTISDAIFANVAPYNQRNGKRDTYNKNDGIYDSRLLMDVTGSYKTIFSASFAIGAPFSGNGGGGGGRPPM